MKKSILFSALGHFSLISALLLLSSQFDNPKTYPSIYQVSLISLPKLEVKAFEKKEATLDKSKLTVKPEKVLPAKSAPKKKSVEPEQKPPQPENKPDSLAQQIEGLGEATFEGGMLESPYYAGIVFAKIKSMWRNPVESASLQATIGFRIEKDGQVSQAIIEVSSGNSLYDQAALRAVLASSPLPPLPAHYAGDELFVHLNFVGVP